MQGGGDDRRTERRPARRGEGRRRSGERAGEGCWCFGNPDRGMVEDGADTQVIESSRIESMDAYGMIRRAETGRRVEGMGSFYANTISNA